MSYSIDVNVLLYASDAGSPHYEAAKTFLAGCVSGDDLLCLAWPTVLSYLRTATHPTIFRRPLSHAEASRNIGALLRLPHARTLAEEEGFWDVYHDVIRDVPVRGNLVADTHLAALLRQHGVTTLYTRDRDFLKFRFLDIRDPLRAVAD